MDVSFSMSCSVSCCLSYCMSSSMSVCMSYCESCGCSASAVVGDAMTHGDEASCNAFSSSVIVAVEAEAVVVEVETVVVTSVDDAKAEDKVDDGW